MRSVPATWTIQEITMGLLRLALVAGLGFGLVAPWMQADEVKTPAQPAATAVKPAPPKDEATVPAIKGSNDQQKAAYVARHEGFMKDKETLLKNGPIQFVLLGDSITDGWRGKNGKSVFDEAFGKYNPYNTGIGGDRTQHLIWRVDNGELDGLNPNPKVAMLMIGTNNLGGNPSNDDIAAGITKIVKEIHEKLPQTKVLLLAIFPRSEKPDNPARARIKAINEQISKLDDGGKTVTYLDIGNKFLAEDGTLPKDVMPDFLHPNAKGYQIWADAIKPTLDEMMK
jgi:lysophospholipase L1-like esterase